MTFEWDEAKAAANLAKHGVSFDDAKTVFDDPLYVDSMIPIIRLMSLVTLSLGRHDKAGC